MNLDVVRSNPFLQLGLFALLLLGVLGLVWWSADILTPFVIAFVLAYILDPAVDWMEDRLGFRRMTSILLLLTLVIIAGIVLEYFLIEEAMNFGQQIQTVLEDPPNVRQWFQRLLPDFMEKYLHLIVGDVQAEALYETLQARLIDNLTELASNLTGSTNFITMFVSRTMGVLNFFINVIVSVFATIYLLRDFDRIVIWVRNEIPPRFRDRADRITGEIDELFRAFLRGHLIICLVVGFLYGTGYLLVGLQGGFLIGFISGLMNVIPYVGSSLGFLLAFVMALAQFGIDPWVITVILVFVVVQSFEGNILRPSILGSAVGINPVIVIFSLMFFGKLMGFLGLLLAVPFAAVLKVLFRHLLDAYHDSEFYRTEAETN
jgi:predicted PurR-regulated permease PerM